ncbi:MAG: hypothetical protein KGQ36_06520 [Rickettsiales bacterium]|nr:hypothetical protein [Rickettsiales bacterium]
MSSKENFVITIGDFGSIVTLHGSNAIKETLFLENLNDESKIKVKALFDKHKSPTISILLDNLDQTYKKKSYPMLNAISLKNIARREMDSDGDKNSFKNYIPFIPKKSSGIKKTDCLFISISKSEIIDEWLKILFELPNRLIGIYALPVESFTLFNLLRKKESAATTGKARNTKLYHNLHCMIMQNKLGGIRQVIFSENGIVFTRIVNYDLQDNDWLEKYEQDIYSTFEYLKRSTPNINITELDITNILGTEFLEKIKTLNNVELKMLNYTPSEAAMALGYNNMLQPDEKFTDLLVSRTFAKGKKVLKFVTPQIVNLEKLFLVLISSYALNGLTILVILVTIISIIMFSLKNRSLVKIAESSKQEAQNDLSKTKILASKKNIEDQNNISGDIEKIIDYGKIDETLESVGTDYLNFYVGLKFLRNYDAVLTEFSYSLNNFDQKAPSSNTKFTVNLKGNINNKSGDIDDLFRNFDSLSNFTKKTFSDYSISSNEIPRTIDFTQRYYTYPIEFTLQK